MLNKPFVIIWSFGKVANNFSHQSCLKISAEDSDLIFLHLVIGFTIFCLSIDLVLFDSNFNQTSSDNKTLLMIFYIFKDNF